ncbi:unnamed protein product [Pseudo-nitzschia multistriata]|uniref:Palmitoyltransferase n=1 Tax=Pseudo-nitzschia multistriata TaxID=183589 RepID=A0A448YWD6_9STRA|nr:unnamed protein product [Pseudo-nitzschia multistriata]
MIAINPIGIAFLVLYLFGSLFIVYYCACSSPSDSETAYFMQVTLPDVLWNRFTRVFGEEHFKNGPSQFLVVTYFCVVGGSWSVVFGRLYPWLLYDSPGLPNTHAVIGVFVFFACFGAWAIANASRPGIVTARSFRRYDHYPYDDLLFQTNTKCQTTKLFKIPRCKYDRMKYDGLIPRYDHYCGWTNNTYGEENYRWFLLFLLQHVIMCFYGTYVACLLFQEEITTKRLMDMTYFDRATGEKVNASKFLIFQYMFARRSKEIGVTLVMFLMGIALTCFLGYHIYITSMGQTTNENSKWGDVKKWYKAKQKMHRAAVEEAKVNPFETSTNSERSTDIGNAHGDSEKQESQESFDPGPIPKNLYNRGFVENWKEVFFPLSLRKDALERGGYTKAAILQQKQQQQERISKEAECPTGSLCLADGATNSSSPRSDKPKDV